MPNKVKVFSRDYAELKFIEADEAFGGGGGYPPIDVIIATGTLSLSILSAIAIGLRKVLTRYFEREDRREVTIEKKDKKKTIKGHSLKEEQEFFEELFPEAAKSSAPPEPSMISKTNTANGDVRLRSDLPGLQE